MFCREKYYHNCINDGNYKSTRKTENWIIFKRRGENDNCNDKNNNDINNISNAITLSLYIDYFKQ